MEQTRRRRRRDRLGRLAEHQDRREHVRRLENLLGVAEVDDLGHPGRVGEETAQRFAVAGLEPLVRRNEAGRAAGAEHLLRAGVEVHVQVGRALVDLREILLQKRLDVLE